MNMKDNYQLSKLKKREKKVKYDSEATKIAISLRIDSLDLSLLRDEADRLGIPYQTLINSLIHRYVNGDLLDKRDIDILKIG